MYAEHMRIGSKKVGMTMADLIDREAVLRAIESASYWGHTFNALCDEARDITAVDAVAVVRCKDCRYLYFKDMSAYCQHAVSACRPDDFCSYGERKMR